MSEPASAGGPLLIGYDGSEQSRDALVLAQLLAPLTGGEAIALAVIAFAPTEATWAEYEEIQREEIERLGREAKAGLSGLSRVDFRSVLAPSPGRELHALAVEEGAGMIVLGSTHRGPIGRVLPGSVADRLLSAAPCPIAVAPRGYRDRNPVINSIAVAYDGSAEAGLALSAAAELAGATGASLRLTSVANPEDARVAGPASLGWSGAVTTQEGVEEERRRVTEELERALANLDPRLGASGDVIVDTHPAAVIAGVSESADLLVMGSRGYGPLGRVLLGGVASHVIRGAGCPVIVTTRPRKEDGGEA